MENGKREKSEDTSRTSFLGHAIKFVGFSIGNGGPLHGFNSKSAMIRF